MIVQPPEVPDAKSYRGHAGIQDAFEDWPSQWENFHLDLIEIIDLNDDCVVSVTRHRGRGRESGIELDFHVAYVSRLRDGKLSRVEMYFDREQALAAARTSG